MTADYEARVAARLEEKKARAAQKDDEDDGENLLHSLRITVCTGCTLNSRTQDTCRLGALISNTYM